MNFTSTRANKLSPFYTHNPIAYKCYSLLTSKNKKTFTRLSQTVLTEDGDLKELTECVCVREREKKRE